MYKRFPVVVIFILLASMFLASCGGGIDAPDSINWTESGDAPSFDFGGGGDAPDNGNDSGSGDDGSSGSDPGDNKVPPDSEYDPNAPPPKFDFPSPWKQFTNAPLQNEQGSRHPDDYLAVILQFGVDQGHCRYNPPCDGGNNNLTDTRCNIFASDVMNAMGAHLPTKGELGVGHGTSKTTDPMPANARDTHNWLEGQHDGWRKLDPNNPNDWAILEAHLAAGKPAVASRSDHIAVIRPDQSGGLATGDTGGLHIAQSGATNSNSTTIGRTFTGTMPDIYIHD